jgi:hypothetical protein
LTVDDPRRLLSYALETYPDRVEIAPVDQLILEAARRNDKRPAYLKLAVPDEVVKQLRGPRQGHDLVFLLRVPREVAARAASPIVLPGEESRRR